MAAGQVLQEPQQLQRGTPNNNLEECDFPEDQVLAQKAILVLKERADAALRETNAQEALVLYREIVMRLTKTHVQASKELELLISCYLNVAAALCQQKQWKQVIQECNQALQITREASKNHPNLEIWLGRTHYFRGFALFSLGKYTQALPDYQAALEYLPKDEAIRQDYEILERALQVEAQVRIEMKNAMDHFGKNQFALAISECNRALKNSIGLKNDDLVGVVHGNMGSIYLKSNNLPKAIEHFKKSLKYAQESQSMDPNLEREFDLLDGLAACYTRQNDLTNAMDAITKTISLLNKCPSRASKAPSLYLNAGRVLFMLTNVEKLNKQQEIQQIKSYFRKVLEMGPSVQMEIRLTSLLWLTKLAIRQQCSAEIHYFFRISIQMLQEEVVDATLKATQLDKFYLLALNYFNGKRHLKEELTSQQDLQLLEDATNYFRQQNASSTTSTSTSISGLLKSTDLLCHFHRQNPSKQLAFLQVSDGISICSIDTMELSSVFTLEHPEDAQILLHLQALCADLNMIVKQDTEKASQRLFKTLEQVVLLKKQTNKKWMLKEEQAKAKLKLVKTSFIFQVWNKMISSCTVEKKEKQNTKMIQVLRKIELKNEEESVFLSDLLVQQAHVKARMESQQEQEQALDLLEEARDLLLPYETKSKRALVHVLVGMCVLQLKQKMYQAANMSLQRAKKLVSITSASSTEEMKATMTQLKALEHQLKPYMMNTTSGLASQTTKMITVPVDTKVSSPPKATVASAASMEDSLHEQSSVSTETRTSTTNMFGVFFWSTLVLAIVLLLPHFPLLNFNRST